MTDLAIKRILDLGFPWQTADPFLFCVHHNDFFPKGEANMAPDPKLLKGRNIGMDFEIKDGWRMYHGDTVPGFPAHPHRGFETITVVTQGYADHADSLGAAGRYGQGDTQWMTAGRGVQHSEMFPLLQDDQENTLELFQIWINLPARSKMAEPHFTMLWKEDIPVIRHQDSAGRTTQIEVVAGEVEGQKAPPPPPESWAADPANEVAVWTLRMDPNATWALPKAGAGVNRCLYVYGKTTIQVNDHPVKPLQGAVLNPDADVTLASGNEPAFALVLQGQPIAEPVAQYGPFVMNTEAEIHQAFTDFRKDEFGGWPWPKRDPVHGRKTGRFAKHADGRVEER
ncbi:MAG: pirin family protein [Natronospirillum sp.]